MSAAPGNVIVGAIPGRRAVADDINILADANNDTAIRNYDFRPVAKRGVGKRHGACAQSRMPFPYALKYQS
jgi:hypothetical protein